MIWSRRQFLALGGVVLVPRRQAGGARTQQSAASALVGWAQTGAALEALIAIAGADWSAHPRERRDAIASVGRGGRFLQTKWKAAEGVSVARVFVDGLVADTEFFRRVRPSPELPPDRQKQFFETVDDVLVKVAQCEKGKAGWASLIHVKVNTLDAARQTTARRQVWYVPRGWSDVPDKWLQFDTLSTPAEAEMAPGMYLFRIDQGPAESRRVGGEGIAAVTFDLIAAR